MAVLAGLCWLVLLVWDQLGWSQLDSSMHLSAAGCLAVGWLVYNVLGCDSCDDWGLYLKGFSPLSRLGRYSYDGRVTELYEVAHQWASDFSVHCLISHLPNCVRFAITHWLKQVSWPTLKSLWESNHQSMRIKGRCKQIYHIKYGEFVKVAYKCPI